MASIYFIYVFLLGLILGSFLNVVILRYNTGRSLGGRSGCFSCGKHLHWYELIPVFSFMVQRGRCRGCQSRISWQYPLVELLGGLLLFLPVWKFYPNISAIAYWWLVLAFLAVIAVYDYRHKIIPDELAYSLAALAFAKPVLRFFMSHWSLPALGQAVWETVAAGGVIFLFFWALWYFSKGRWMGFGDAKLGFALGALLGNWEGAVTATILAFWIGAVVGIVLLLLSYLGRFRSFRGRFTGKTEVPFAPFLILGFLIQLFVDLNLITLPF